MVASRVVETASGGSAVACAAFGLYELSGRTCGAAASGVVACARCLCLAVGRTAHTISGCRACLCALRRAKKLVSAEELVVEYASLVDTNSRFDVFSQVAAAPSARVIETSNTTFRHVASASARNGGMRKR